MWWRGLTDGSGTGSVTSIHEIVLEPVLENWFHVTREGTKGHHQGWDLQCTLGNQADSILTQQLSALVL